MRKRSCSLTLLNEDKNIITVSLEDFQAMTQEGLFYGIHDTPFGLAVGAVFQNRLCGLVFQGNVHAEYLVEQAQRHLRTPLTYYHPEVTAPFVERVFRDEIPPILLAGTPFQLGVWQYLLSIPKGSVITYRELAKGLGRPQVMRSVGQALKSNPLAYVFPCHRIISSSGRMGGYRWGVGLKEQILAAEGYHADSSEGSSHADSSEGYHADSSEGYHADSSEGYHVDSSEGSSGGSCQNDLSS